MTETASARAIRLLDMVPFLSAHPGISIKEIASEFKISTSQLISDLNLLFLCGLPGYTPLELIDLSFDDGFVVVKEPQNLAAPRNLTDTELLYLLVGLSTLEAQVDGPKKEQVKALREKVRKSTQSRIPVGIVDSDSFKPELSEVVEKINQALSERKRLLISYNNQTRDSIMEREVSPYRLIKENEKVYLEGYVHDVNAPRIFNLEKILRCKILEIECVEMASRIDSQIYVIRFKADKDSSFLREHAANIRKVDEKMDIYEMSIFQKEWLLRNVMRASGEVEIVEPHELREEVRKVASAALSNYQE